jgi:hypothetical protein
MVNYTYLFITGSGLLISIYYINNKNKEIQENKKYIQLLKDIIYNKNVEIDKIINENYKILEETIYHRNTIIFKDLEIQELKRIIYKK